MVPPLTETIPKPKRFHIRKAKTNPRRIAYLILMMFAIPPAWPQLTLGVLLVLAAVLFHGWAAGYLARAGYEERETVLTVRGPYRYNRNPYYVAHMTMDLGFFIIAGLPLFFLLYFPIIFSVYRSWVVNEERFLEKEFGDDYRSLKREVPRWRVRLTPASPRGPEQVFEWAIFKINRETHRSLSHIFFLCLLLVYFFIGNPFTEINSLFRVTVISAIIVWLVSRDIYPLDVAQKSAGWALLALGSAAITTIFLLNPRVWEYWSGTGAWVSISGGLFFGLLVSATAFPASPRIFGHKEKEYFRRPASQWYVLGLAFGLLSCNLGGVWLGIMLPFHLWALGIAGLIPLKGVPQRFSVGLGLLMVVVFSGGLAVVRLLT